MFTSLRKVVPMLLLSALLISACSNPSSVTQMPPIPGATSTPMVGGSDATAIPTETPVPTATFIPTNTPAPTTTPIPLVGDACLVGTWEVVDMSDYFAGVMSRAENMASIVAQSGQMLYSFTPDSQAAIKAEDFQDQIDVKVQGMAFKMVVAMNGQATSTYTTTVPDKVTFVNPDNSGFKISATLNGQDFLTGATADEFDAAFGISPDPKYATSTYQCEGDTLKITPPVPGARAVVLKRFAP